MRITCHIPAVAVQHVEIDEVGEDQAMFRGLFGLLQQDVEQGHVVRRL